VQASSNGTVPLDNLSDPDPLLWGKALRRVASVALRGPSLFFAIALQAGIILAFGINFKSSNHTPPLIPFRFENHDPVLELRLAKQISFIVIFAGRAVLDIIPKPDLEGYSKLPLKKYRPMAA
jgi:hypothetical protein